MIEKRWMDDLHAYLGGIVRELNGFPQCVGGVEDHVHLLVGLKATHTLSNFMRELKTASSSWIHSELCQPGFAWQEGYGAFTLAAADRNALIAYIDRQEERHKSVSARDEFIRFLQDDGVMYRDEYV